MHARMILSLTAAYFEAVAFPRERGDDPNVDTNNQSVVYFSSSMRG